MQKLGELLQSQWMLEQFGGFLHLFIGERVQVDAAARDEKGAEYHGARGRDVAVGRQAQQQALVVGDAHGVANASVETGDVAADKFLHRIEGVVERVRVGRGAGRNDENLDGCGFRAPVENLVLVPLAAWTHISGFAVGVVGRGVEFVW